MNVFVVLSTVLIAALATAKTVPREYSNEELLAFVLNSPELAQLKAAKGFSSYLDKVALIPEKKGLMIYLGYENKGKPCAIRAAVVVKDVPVLKDLDGACDLSQK